MNERDWLIRASDLLAEPDPGPTPWLVEGLVVAQALVACVGRWKTTKSWGLLDLCVSVATGEAAFGALRVPEAGSVLYVCEESGRAALWRRLDALARGRGIDRDRLDPLVLAANARVKLDDPGWQAELLDVCGELQPKLTAFDPLARMKGADRDENSQREIAPLIEFMRELRDETGTGVLFVHHTGHEGERMRGSSDLESAWETRLTWKRDPRSAEVTVESEHREAEASGPIRYRIAWDHATRSMRLPLVEGDLLSRVRAYLTERPEASGNEVHEHVGGNRQKVLEAVRTVRAEPGSGVENWPGTTPARTSPRSGSTEGSFRSLGTTSAESPSDPVPDAGTDKEKA